MMNKNFLNLIVVAHPDDEILGFGGTDKLLIDSGDSVQPLILSGSVDARTFRPKDNELLTDIKSANKLVNFNYPQLGSFPNIQFNSTH